MLCASVCAAEPETLLRANDVVAFVGGEDMVSLAELGYLETLLTVGMPDLHLRFRSLAWEGDTVYEQRRDLNYPPLDAQLESIGATMVVVQFGSMESLEGKGRAPEFLSAFERLVSRFSGNDKRRIVVMTPGALNLSTVPADGVPTTIADYSEPLVELSQRHGWKVVDILRSPVDDFGAPEATGIWRDDVHFSERGQAIASVVVAEQLGMDPWKTLKLSPETPRRYDAIPARLATFEALRNQICQKNLLWFHYYRPQNWAFLAGDRTNQPSSRDYRDLSKRWFPDEMKQWLPLIEQAEGEIRETAENQMTGTP